MATRFQTYELEEGNFGTYDTQTETLPTEFLRGPFDVNISEANDIQDGAMIAIENGQAVVYFEGGN